MDSNWNGFVFRIAEAGCLRNWKTSRLSPDFRPRISNNKIMRQIFFLESAFASARHRKNAAQARVWLERATKLQKPKSVNSVEAEIALCEGRYEEAIQFNQKAREFVGRVNLTSGLSRLGMESLNEQRKRAEEMAVAHNAG